jgi:phosphonate transport system substrate-binding protein
MKRRPFLTGCLAAATLGLIRAGRARAEAPTYSFGVLNQRSVALIAEYWNPILLYVSRRTGFTLELKVGRTAMDTTAMALRQELDFTYSNHLFWPDRLHLGYHVIARPDTEGIRGEINVLDSSPIRDLVELRGQEVGFPSKESFVAYLVTMDALLKAGIKVAPVFAGNQEGAMGQLRAGRVPAVSVNSRLMTGFAKREGVPYRTLWHSDLFQDIPVMAHGRVPARVSARVRDVLAGMADDPEGAAILTQVAKVWGMAEPVGFVGARDVDYESYFKFYRNLSPALAAAQ